MFVEILLLALVISVIVWVVQESVGRPCRMAQLTENKDALRFQGSDYGFPSWLKILSVIVAVVWFCVLGTLLNIARVSGLSGIGDFSLILVLLTITSGIVAGVDRAVFRGRRVRLMGAAPVQRSLSKIKNPTDKQLLVDWAETDFVFAEYAKSFFPVLLAVLLLRSFLLEPFKIPSASMVPTLQVHDFILVNKFAYGLRLPVLGTNILPVGMPQRGDVMVFYPPNDKRYFIKRVIGLPGDQIHLQNNVLYINGVKMEQHFLYTDNSSMSPQMVIQEDLQPHEHLMQHLSIPTPQSNYDVVVPEGQYFMMGDNRDNSSDSRFWGMVPESNVVGQAVYVWMHWGALLSLPSFSRNGVIQ